MMRYKPKLVWSLRRHYPHQVIWVGANSLSGFIASPFVIPIIQYSCCPVNDMISATPEQNLRCNSHYTIIIQLNMLLFN